MVSTILLIQFRVDGRAAELERLSIVREIGETVSLRTVSALDEAVDWDNPAQLLHTYQGVIFGGSGDFDFDGGRSDADESRVMVGVLLERLRPTLGYIFAHDFPTLGICFGHQLLGAFAGAQVVCDSVQGKTRSHPVEILSTYNELALLTGMPQTFDGYYIHKDSLDRLPDGAELLGHGGEACRYSVLRYKKNIYTTQFHPELTFDDVLVRIDTFPGYLPNGVTADQVFSREVQANTIVSNFGKLLTVQ
jgi:GMP synthase (glutamine-hydrolysing)